MRVVLASSDAPVRQGLAPAFASDDVTAVDLAASTEPDAFAIVDATQPEAIVLVPRWGPTGPELPADVAACWWWGRAADFAEIPVVLLSTAAVFGGRSSARWSGGAWSEFDRPAPTSAGGRAADAAEQLLARTTRHAVVVRVGPLDVGATALPALLTTAEGVHGGPDALVTPVSVAALGPALRTLAAGRRPGVYHLESGMLSLAESASRLGLAAPRAGRAPVPPPLVGHLPRILGQAPLAPWPAPQQGPAPRAGAADG